MVAMIGGLVIYGLVATEVAAVLAGDLEASRMLPTWLLQAALLALFASGFHHATLARWAARPA
jgi:hypothetical protein